MKQMKKVVFYNTSIDSVLRDGEKALDKMEYVFKTMKEKKGVVLWWRPHPLTISTIEAMRPELQNRYKALIEWFCKEKIGIYDDTSDLNRAIAASDAYYGNWSSLIYLYMAAGKPVLISKAEKCEKTELRIEIADFVEADHKLWFTALNFNGLFYYDLEICKTRMVGEIPGERGCDSKLFYAIAASGRYIILIPSHSKFIVRYDRDSKTFERRYLSGIGACRFICCKGTGDDLYLFPNGDSHITRYQVSTQKMEPLFNVENQKNGARVKFKRRIAVAGQDFYSVSGEDNTVCQFSPADSRLRSWRIGDREISYDWVGAMGDFLFLISCNGVLITHKEGGKLAGTIDFPEGFIGGESPFADIVDDGESLYLFPDTANMAIKVNMKQRESSCFFKCREGASGQYTCARLSGDSIYGFLGGDQGFQAIDRRTGKAVKFSLNLTEAQTAEIMERKMLTIRKAADGEPSLAFLEVENELVTFRRFVDAIGDELDEAKEQGVIPNRRYFFNADGNCGKRVFEMIKHKISK